MPGLAIFDCDGVLVDSEPISSAVLARVLSEHGLPTSTAEALRTYKGLVLRDVIERAGVAARMRVLGYAADSDAAELAEAGAEPFDSLVELPRLIGVR